MSGRSLEDAGGAPPLFVSYRRTDAFAADLLVQELHHAFGARNVVQDTLTFAPGASFPEQGRRP